MDVDSVQSSFAAWGVAWSHGSLEGGWCHQGAEGLLREKVAVFQILDWLAIETCFLFGLFLYIWVKTRDFFSKVGRLMSHFANHSLHQETFAVFIDGGVRRGGDIFKAVALGAQAGYSVSACTGCRACHCMGWKVGPRLLHNCGMLSCLHDNNW